MSQTKKILLIDDEPEITEMLKFRLESYQYQIITATNGDEGLQLAEKEKPDLVISDVMMPKMDGYTFVREMKSRASTRNIPIIVLTAKPGMKDLFAMEGISDYLIKPYKPEELVQKVRQHLG